MSRGRRAASPGDAAGSPTASNIHPPADEPALDIRGATVRFGGRDLWRDVSLKVEMGQFVAVLGPNGAGKSTLIKAVLGLLPLRAGEIRVMGESPVDARRRVGYLPQRRTFDLGVRVRGVDVVRLGLDGARWGVPLPWSDRWSQRRRDELRRIDEVIDLVGATSYAGRPVGQMSGGEQQRLLVAQALVRGPELLLLDEPLDSLDPPNQAAVARLISTISSSERVTVVMVAHDVNPILPYLDVVAYLAGGSVVSGPVQTVINTETLSRLYGTAIEVLHTSDGRLVVVGHPEAEARRSTGQTPGHFEEHVDRHTNGGVRRHNRRVGRHEGWGRP